MGNKHSSSLPPLRPRAQAIDTMKFMGNWFVIAVKPTYFEIGASNSVENYKWNEKLQQVDILFTYTMGKSNKAITQTGFIQNPSVNTEWKLQPFWPLKLPYYILEVSDDYSYTVIGYPSREYVWIMARSKTMDEVVYEGIIDRLNTHHLYDLHGLVKVNHD